MVSGVVTPPLVAGGQEEDLFRWYFEDRLHLPWLGHDREQRAEAALEQYGQLLWSQLFGGSDVAAAVRGALRRPKGRLEVAGPAGLHAISWELLRDPEQAEPVAVRVPIVRHVRSPAHDGTRVVPAPGGCRGPRILLVTARPGGSADVAYRTVSSPLVHAATPRGSVHVLRPATSEQLIAHLAQVGPGWYDIAHFDAHATSLSAQEVRQRFRFDPAPDLDLTFEGRRPFLLFETGHERLSRPVPATELASVLTRSAVRIVVLTACRSATPGGERVESMAHDLAAAGIPAVIGMRRNISVSAVEIMVEPLYAALLRGGSPAQAATAARRALARESTRLAWLGRHIAIEDWSLPVVYEGTPEAGAVAERIEAAHEPAAPPQTPHGLRPDADQSAMAGRDLEVQTADRLIAGAEGRQLLIRGVIGAGKTTFLRHVLWWWSVTGFVEESAYLALGRVELTAESVIAAIARAIDPDADPSGGGVERLRARDLVVGIDDVDRLVNLDAAQRARITDFLHSLTGGRLVVVYAARGGLGWLTKATFGDAVVALGALDRLAFSAHADALGLSYEDPPLVTLDPGAACGGFPGVLAAVAAAPEPHRRALLRAVLGSSERPPAVAMPAIADVVAGLEPNTQAMLPYFAPLIGVVPLALFEDYERLLRDAGLWPAEPAHLGAALFELFEVGLAIRVRVPVEAIWIHPLLSCYVRARQPDDVRVAVEATYSTLLHMHATELFGLSHRQEDPGGRSTAWSIAGAVAPNLERAVYTSLRQDVPVVMLASMVANLLLRDQRWADLLAFALRLSAAVNEAEDGGTELLGVAADAEARGLLGLGRVQEAERRYRDALEWLTDDGLVASVHHQLGLISQRRNDHETAKSHYETALARASDPYVTGRALQQLARLAQEHRDTDTALRLYNDAAAVFMEAGDQGALAKNLYQQAVTAQEADRLDDARTLCLQARDRRRMLGDRRGESHCEHQLSIIAGKLDDLDGARQHVTAALRLAAAAGHRGGEAAALHRLAELSVHDRDAASLAEAERLLRQAQQALSTVNDMALLAAVHGLRGRVLTQLGRYDAAVADSVRALLIRSSFPYPVGDDVSWLRRQRHAVGASTFRRLLTSAVGEEQAQLLLEALPPYPDPGPTGSSPSI